MCGVLYMQLQQGIQGILVLDARDGSPARLAGVNGTRRDQSGRLVLGDIISAFNGKKVKCVTSERMPPLPISPVLY